MAPGADALAEWDEFGPPGQGNGPNKATDYECTMCDVWWHRNNGPECWSCGFPGRPAKRTIMGMNVRWTETMEQ